MSRYQEILELVIRGMRKSKPFDEFTFRVGGWALDTAEAVARELYEAELPPKTYVGHISKGEVIKNSWFVKIDMGPLGTMQYGPYDTAEQAEDACSEQGFSYTIEVEHEKIQD